MLRPARAAAAACRARQRRRCSAPAAGWQPPTAAAAAAAGASVAAFLQQEHAVRVYREICARKVPDGRVSSALGAARSSGYDSEAVVLTVSRFNRLCEEQGVRDHAECKALLRALHDAGVVFHVPGETDEEIGLVWLCPERIHAAAREEAGVPAADSPSELLGEEGARRLAEIRAELARLEEEKQAADVRVAAWWRNFGAASADPVRPAGIERTGGNRAQSRRATPPLGGLHPCERNADGHNGVPDVDLLRGRLGHCRTLDILYRPGHRDGVVPVVCAPTRDGDEPGRRPHAASRGGRAHLRQVRL
eukprot:TRINITY_DN34399_c0_g1_i1.p1 TRINITY_DN34399_c0_g1~~TRINITY_DN34399_c0_g1_i1.p1  ORF type:complete len:306 (+),score=42.44 TRINITY_DN34399_c0_g1_i1:70-987(+)